MKLHLSLFHYFIFLLNIVGELKFFVSSGSVFQRLEPLDMKELATIAFIFKFGVCNRFFACSSYFKPFFSKNFNMTDRHGFLLIDTYKFEELIFANSLCELLVHLFFRNNS